VKLIHFADPDVDLAPRSVEQNDRPYKPHGLWVSDEGPSSVMSWSEWCLSEDYGDISNKTPWLISVDLDRITHLTTVDEVRAFTAKFTTDHFGMGIDWPAVAADHAGILITPYQWSLRFDIDHGWYYGWDCASGCIWDTSAILGVERVTTEGTKP
jgi:hypothetical protein